MNWNNHHAYLLLFIGFYFYTAEFSLQAMNESSLQALNATLEESIRLIQCTQPFFDSIKKFMPTSEEFYLPQSKVSILKNFSSKLFEFCYNNPKLCFGGTSLTLGLFLLRSSRFWPITKSDLCQLNNNNEQHLKKQTLTFKEALKNHTQNRTCRLGVLFDNSHNNILALQRELGATNGDINKLPNFVTHILQQTTESSRKEQDALLMYEQLEHKDALQKAQGCVAEMVQENEAEFSHNLDQVLQFKKDFDNDIKKTLEKVTGILAQEPKKITKHKEFLSTIEHQADNDDVKIKAIEDQLNALLLMLSGDFSQLTQENDTFYSELAKILQDHESILATLQKEVQQKNGFHAHKKTE